MIRDQIVFENKMNFLQTKCFACSSKDHVSINCPLVHYVPNKVRLIREYARDPGQKTRSKFQRSRNNKVNTLTFMKNAEFYSKKFKMFSEYYFNGDDPDLYAFSLSELDNDEENIDSDQMPQQSSQTEIPLSQNFIKPPSSSSNLESEDRASYGKSRELIDSIGLPIIEAEEVEETKIDTELDFIKLPCNLNNFTNVEPDSQKYLEPRSINHISHLKKKPSIDIFIEKSVPIRKSYSENRGSPFLKKKTGGIEKKTLKFEEAAFNWNGNPLQTQTSIIKKISSKTQENEKLPNSPEKIDLFDKEFEKGANLKNFYPDHNLSNFIELQKKSKMLKKMKNKMRNMRTSAIKKSQFILKTNKVFPEMEEDKQEHGEKSTLPSRFGSTNTKKEKEKKRYSNIFTIRREASFFAPNKKLTFYDVIYEVLHNSELRKKLQGMRDKSFQKKKTLY